MLLIKPITLSFSLIGTCRNQNGDLWTTQLMSALRRQPFVPSFASKVSISRKNTLLRMVIDKKLPRLFHSKNQNQTSFFLCPVEKAPFLLLFNFSQRRHYLGIFYCDSLTSEQRFRTKNLMTQFRRFCMSLYKAY